jgi:hypothetical protein
LVTIAGANFQAGATVSFGGTAASSPTVSSSIQIKAVTPAHLAGNADVIVQNPNGESGTLSNGFIYNVPSPTVASVSPNSGPTTGGTKVVITGTNFLAGALILFGGASATAVTVNSATQIQAVTPVNAAGPADVTVEDPGNVSAKLFGGFTYNSSSSGAPTISGVSPSSGAPGTQVTVTGTNFSAADTVAFGSTNAAPTMFVSTTQLTTTVPSISTGTYSVTVTDPEPASATLTNGFTVASVAGGQSLLSGCSFIGSGGCSLPSGWTLVAQQDFECVNSHASPANPSCGQLPASQTTSAQSVPTGFKTVQVHNGTYAFGGLYSSDDSQVNWIVTGGAGAGQLGSFHTVYISWWEYTDPNARYGNSDYYLFHMVSPTSCSGVPQDVAYDAQPSVVGGPPASIATMLPIANGSETACGQAYYQWSNGAKSLAMMAGQWRQVEVLYTPSTSVTPPQSSTPTARCTSSSIPGCGNGSLQLFINGQLSQQSLNANLNGTTSMANSDVEVGGVITDFCDAAEKVRATPFTLCPSAAPSAFNRYFDDIIILKK